MDVEKTIRILAQHSRATMSPNEKLELDAALEANDPASIVQRNITFARRIKAAVQALRHGG